MVNYGFHADKYDYYLLADLAIFGITLLVLGLTLYFCNRRDKRGATKATRKEIIMHQKVRRAENEL